jgi:hypothetical protein
MIFSFHLPIFDKNRLISGKIRPEIATPIFEKITDLSGKSAN